MSIEIPVVKIKPVGEVFKPTAGDIESGINKKLNERIKNAVCKIGKNRIIPMNPTSPHTTGDHMVFWIDQAEDSEQTSPWTSNSWTNLLANTEFLQSVEKYFQELQIGNPVVKVYMYLGFARPENIKPMNGKYLPPMQSQNRPHIHGTELINTWSNEEARKLDLNNPSDQKQLGSFLNQAGERAINDYDSQLEGYGHRFIYKQKINGDSKESVDRTMFGFNSLQEALLQSTELQRRVLPTWESYIENLSKEITVFDNLELPLIQSYIPNITIIIPSKMDRENGKVKNDFPVWTMPFGTVGAQVLVPGGVVTERATPYDSVAK